MNRQYNEEIACSAFWLEMPAQLSVFERLVQRHETLTATDKKALKRIRQAFRECYEVAKKQSSYHSRQLERIKREYLDDL